MGFGRSNYHGRIRNARRQAIAETNAYLSWALSTDEPAPRIPRRRVDRGGFGEMMRRPMAMRIVSHWWEQALERVRDI